MRSKISVKVIEKSTIFTLIIYFSIQPNKNLLYTFFSLLNNYFLSVFHTPLRPNAPTNQRPQRNRTRGTRARADARVSY
jgi:hypothetical protein